MTNQAAKIITWATSEFNENGAHVEALTMALESGRVEGQARIEGLAKKEEWVREHNIRIAS